jgi:Uma2 family endonuclease
MTYEEFLEWADEDTHAEWVNGEVVYMSPVSRAHQRVTLFLAALMQHLLERRGLGGLILAGPFQMKTGPDLPGREPDVIYIAGDHVERCQPNHLRGPGDLVVEVISPESRTRDRVEKLSEYEEGGVREYWLIDPVRKQAEFHVLGEDGRYRRQAVEEDGVYRSRVLEGFWIRLEWLFRETPPPLLDVLKEWGIV